MLALLSSLLLPLLLLSSLLSLVPLPSLVDCCAFELTLEVLLLLELLAACVACCIARSAKAAAA